MASLRDEIGARMLELVGSFPVLDDCPLSSWDARAFAEYLERRCECGSKRHAALFVLAVWNPSYVKQVNDGKPFDLFAALRTWDNEQLGAFARWAVRPWQA